MRSFKLKRVFTRGALLSLAVDVAIIIAGSEPLCAAPGTTGEPATAPAGATQRSVAEFDSLYSQWEALIGKRKMAAARVKSPVAADGDAAKAQIVEVSRQADELLPRLVAAAEAAYAADKSNKTVTAFLFQYAQVAFQEDRFEDTARIVRLLVEHDFENHYIYKLGAYACLEIDELDEATAYFRRAEEAGISDGKDARYLQVIEAVREPSRRERTRRAAEASADNLPRVLVKTTQGDLLLELFENDAPNAVANFISLVAQKFYDDLEFFRVVKGFGALVGCPKGDGTGGPGYEIAADVDATNYRPHMRGSVSLVAASPGRCGSQVLFVTRPSQTIQFNAQQPVIGRIIDGMDVLTRLQPVDPHAIAVDLPPDRILTATVVRKRNHAYKPVTLTDVANKYVAAATVALRRGRVDEAIEQFKEAVRFDPGNFDAYYRAGDILFQQKKFEAAAYALKHAHKLEPTHLGTLTRLGRALFHVKRYEDAAIPLKSVLVVRPDDNEARIHLALALEKLDSRDEALLHAKEVLRRAPGEARAEAIVKRLEPPNR